MGSRKLLIVGAAGTGNLGDEAILAGILKKVVAGGFCRDRIVVFSKNPEETALLHNINAKRKNLLDLLLSDVVLIGGGELFQDIKHMALKYSLLGLAAKILGKQVVFYAVGVSSMKSRIGRLFAKTSLALADDICVRDIASRDRLRRLGIHRRIRVVEDSALSLEPSLLLTRTVDIPRKDGEILLGIVPQCVRDRKLNEKIHSSFLNYTQSILSRHNNVIIVSIPFWFSRDAPCGEWLERRLNNKRFKVLRERYTYQESMYLLGQLDILVSTRLHPLILAFKVGIPEIGIGISEKVESFCKQRGIPFVNIEEVNRLLQLTEELGNLKLGKNCFGSQN